MPVKFGQTSIRFWFFLSYLITTVNTYLQPFSCKIYRSKVYPKCLPTFASIFAKYVAKGTEKESHLLAMLICGHGLDIVKKFSASQIIKQDAILPKNPSKKEALEKLKVRKK